MVGFDLPVIFDRNPELWGKFPEKLAAGSAWQKGQGAVACNGQGDKLTRPFRKSFEECHSFCEDS
jgi:hypothetical protein